MRKINLLVVCSANQARSPAAVAVFRQALDRDLRSARHQPWRIQSAGTDAEPGRPIWPQMAAAMTGRGLDVSPHRARLVTVDMLEASDLVLTMTEDQRQRVNRALPEMTARTFTLKEADRLLSSAQWDPAWDGTHEIVERMHRLRPVVPTPSEAEDIRDPVPGSASLSRRVLAEIERLVERVSQHMIESHRSERVVTKSI